MDIDYRNLDAHLDSGMLRESLQRELASGFREMRAAGTRLPPPSHYAARIVEIIHAGAETPIERAFDLYQEVLLACEAAADEVGGR